MTVLVVDDAIDSIATLKLALEPLADLEIRTALSAEAALSELESGTFAAVITDIHLPEMSGLDLVTRIRENPRFRTIPILVVSADADPRTPALALSLGANAYFAKPFSPSAMRKKLEELIHAS